MGLIDSKLQRKSRGGGLAQRKRKEGTDKVQTGAKDDRRDLPT